MGENKKQLSQDTKTAKKKVAKPNAFSKDIIVDRRGQWDHPGKITRIPGNKRGTPITMQGVPYPVLGIDNQGNQQMMFPGQDYVFPGSYVTEYPRETRNYDPGFFIPDPNARNTDPGFSPKPIGGPNVPGFFGLPRWEDPRFRYNPDLNYWEAIRDRKALERGRRIFGPDFGIDNPNLDPGIARPLTPEQLWYRAHNDRGFDRTPVRTGIAFQEGGESDFFETEMDDNQIAYYRSLGYRVEELPKHQTRGQVSAIVKSMIPLGAGYLGYNRLEGTDLSTGFGLQQGWGQGTPQQPTFQKGGEEFDPEMIFWDQYNTPLKPGQQKRFDKWAAKESERQGRDILMDKGAYDLQGFWKSGDYKRMDKDNHGSDTWKKPNHPTFSTGSKYVSDENPGGLWLDDGSYYPSYQTSQLYGPEYYEWLFGREPNRPEHYAGSLLPEVTVTGERQMGGEPYQETELDDDQIEYYKRLGYRVEEVPSMQNGGTSGLPALNNPVYVEKPTGWDYMTQTAQDKWRKENPGILVNKKASPEQAAAAKKQQEASARLKQQEQKQINFANQPKPQPATNPWTGPDYSVTKAQPQIQPEQAQLRADDMPATERQMRSNYYNSEAYQNKLAQEQEYYKTLGLINGMSKEEATANAINMAGRTANPFLGYNAKQPYYEQAQQMRTAADIEAGMFTLDLLGAGEIAEIPSMLWKGAKTLGKGATQYAKGLGRLNFRKPVNRAFLESNQLPGNVAEEQEYYKTLGLIYVSGSYRPAYSASLTPDLNELRRVYHNAERFLTPRENALLHKYGHGLPKHYLNPSNAVNNSTNALDLETLRRRYHRGERNFTRAQEGVLIENGAGTKEDYLLPEELFNLDGSPRDLLNRSRGWRQFKSASDNPVYAATPKIPKNKSGLTKEEVLEKATPKDKEVVSKMSETEFENTVLKPTGEIVPYYQGSSESKFPGFENIRPMEKKEYVNRFNEKLDLLNEIIARRNKSGINYRVKGLDESGRLTFETPEQRIPSTLTDKQRANIEWFNRDPEDFLINKVGLKQEGNKWLVPDLDPTVFNSMEEAIEWTRNELKSITEPKISGESVWGLNIIPGTWKGDVEDIVNTDYFRSIPGLEMSNTTEGVFSDNVARRGTGAYESINEYLKELGLGRVKPGFNSQTDFSRGAWENFVKSGRGVGFYANPGTVYGTLKSIAPYVGTGYLGYLGLEGSNSSTGFGLQEGWGKGQTQPTFQQGGEPFETEMDEDAIEYYRRLGYRIEEI